MDQETQKKLAHLLGKAQQQEMLKSELLLHLAVSVKDLLSEHAVGDKGSRYRRDIDRIDDLVRDLDYLISEGDPE